MKSTHSAIWEDQVTQVEETLGRLTLEWSPSDSVSIISKTSFTDFDMVGDNTEYIDCGAGFLGFMAGAQALGPGPGMLENLAMKTGR